MKIAPKKVFTRNLLAAAIAVSVSMAAAIGTAAQADEKPVPKITIIGEGWVSVAPDMAIMDLGVAREAATARQALSDNNAAMADVIAAMKAAGIEEKDLQTSNFHIRPRYVYHRPKKGEEARPPEIVGYIVSNSVTVRIHDLSRIGEVLDESVTLGVNQGGHIRFTNHDPKSEISRARKRAMHDAIDRASTLLDAAGASLGKILEISESFSAPQPVPVREARMMAADGAATTVPIEGGENSYNVHVTVTWQINQ